MSPQPLAITIMVITLMLGLLGILYFHRRGGDGMWLRQILVADFVVSYPISGLVHVWPLSTDRGYYDAIAGGVPGATTGLVRAAVACLLAELTLMIALAAFARPPATRGRPVWAWAQRDRVLASLMGAALASAAGFALLRVMRHASALNAERVVEVPPGEARYVFLASWFPWAVTLLALVITSRRTTPASTVWNALVLTGAMGGVFFSFAWSGGRAETMVYGIPIIALLLPRLKVLRAPYAIGGAILGALFIMSKTLARTKDFEVWGLLDWQWGRFSMVAWADDYARTFGYVGGETLANGYLNVPWAIAHFVGLAPPMEGVRSIVQLSGSAFVGDTEKTHIVPGMVSELYINFGLPGVIVGHVILGVVASLVADWFRDAAGEMEKVLAAYLGSVILFETVVAQSGAFLPYAIQSGLPLWGFWLIERARRRAATRDHDTSSISDRTLLRS
ncbi:hypothetical protein [Arsenicicoccus cauae]|uniref:hypothetical protein n=1 Tax=Arsenicicoccus cauae TaxID=2663847 RepID=UPI0018A7DD04|nr:hypothetical protein [Arsenicicoccus cauae]